MSVCKEHRFLLSNQELDSNFSIGLSSINERVMPFLTVKFGCSEKVKKISKIETYDYDRENLIQSHSLTYDLVPRAI